MSQEQTILFPGEADQMIQSLEPLLPEMIASSRWYKQQQYIDRLNLQAVLSASNRSDEFIKEFLINHRKFDILIECLICIEIWKENVFKKLIEIDFDMKNENFGVYTILYHEATIVNLLEIVLYHEDAIESVENGLLDLVDYCHRRLCRLLGSCEDRSHQVELFQLKSGMSRDIKESGGMRELADQEKLIQFEISLKCLSILNYFITHLNVLPLSVTNRLYQTFDIPVLLVGIVEKSPWIVELDNGCLHKFVDNKWIQQNNWLEIRNNISKLEGQIWLSIYQLIFSDTYQDKYELNSYRKATILRLRSHLSNVLMDHLPMLADLRKYLEQLSISDTPNIKPSLILEQVAEFRDTILTTYEKKWESVVISFCDYLNSPKYQDDLKRQAKAWSDTYNFDNIDQLIDDNPKCVVCGKEAAKRCSRCKSEWYCRRECQVQHWQRHKVACDLLVDVQNKSI